MLITLLQACTTVGTLFIAGLNASPVAVRDSPGLAFRSSTIEETLALHARTLPPITLGSYDLTTSHESDVLFNFGAGTTDGTTSEFAHLELICIDCKTWGTAIVTTTGVSKDENIIGDIISFFENPVDTIMAAFGLDIKISFENVGGHFEFDLLASDTLSYSYPLFMSTTPTGTAVSEEVSVGFVVFIDLVFSLTAEIDLEAGFEFAFPEGAYLTVDPIGGHIIDHGFLGGEVNNLPVTVTSGSATFKAGLRVRIQAGTTVMCFGTGFDFELGVYADLIEYEATLGSTPDCELSVTESVDVNIGAFAHVVGEINYSTMGASPAVITTVLDVLLPSLCLTRPIATILSDLPPGTAVPVVSMTAASAENQSTGLPFIPAPVLSMTAASTNIETGSISASIPYFSLIPSSTTTSITASTTSPPSSSSSIIYANGTITPAASLTTSTVYATSLITITSCSSTVLNCPASLTSEIVITSTTLLYTTVCPVGAAVPSTSPTALKKISSASSGSVAKTGSLVSPILLTPCATVEVSTIYTPTFVNPTYTMPTATSFTVPYPNWNSTTSDIPLITTSSATVVPTVKAFASLSSASNGTSIAITTSKPTAPLQVTSNAEKGVVGAMIGLVVMVGMSLALI